MTLSMIGMIKNGGATGFIIKRISAAYPNTLPATLLSSSFTNATAGLKPVEDVAK